MNHCDTCKHWTQSTADVVDDQGYGSCDRTENYFDHENREGPPLGKELAYSLGNERYHANLIARRDFGCVQHESK